MPCALAPVPKEQLHSPRADLMFQTVFFLFAVFHLKHYQTKQAALSIQAKPNPNLVCTCVTRERQAKHSYGPSHGADGSQIRSCCNNRAGSRAPAGWRWPGSPSAWPSRDVSHSVPDAPSKCYPCSTKRTLSLQHTRMSGGEQVPAPRGLRHS